MERVRSIFVQGCGYAAAVALAAMMLLTVADVVLRSAFNYPIRGMLEIIELLLACSFFVALPASFLRDEHIIVDMIDPMAPAWVPTLKRIGEMITLVVVAAMLWQDEAALRDVAGADLDRPMGGPELSRFWAAEPSIEHFDALTAVEARPDAPALFLTDDRRRYVHATPAAARLSGRPLARLLTMRVEDMTRASERAAVPDAFDRFVQDGSAEGPYVIARPDGSEVPVRFAAKANAPWPGSHASVLVATAVGAPDVDLDLDAALVDAGFVVRYAAG